MAGSFLDLDLELDDAELRRGMAGLREGLANLRPFFADVGEFLQLAHRARWDLEVAPDGTPWEALDPEYTARKPRRQDQILVLDEALRDTLRAQPGRTELQFGTNVIYGATHQFGDPDRGIPARPWLGLSDDDENEIVRLAIEHLNDAARP